MEAGQDPQQNERDNSFRVAVLDVAVKERNLESAPSELVFRFFFFSIV